MSKIYFIASFGNLNKLPLGGGQTAARRLLSTLQKLGYDVVAIHRHPPTSKHKLLRGIQFAFLTLADLILIFFRLVFCRREKALVLYMGYLGNILIPFEFSIAWISRMLGFRNAMYLAGGGTEYQYHRCNNIMKFFERNILHGFNAVMTEGYENIAFVEQLSHAKTFYLPNFTEDGFAPSTIPYKPNDRWNMIYFGRVCPTKNVLLGIDIFDRLCQQFDNIYYTIVGGGSDDYCKQVEMRIEKSPNRDRIKRIGRSSHDVLKIIMADQHFFLFPSTEPREGHSNALNEAMSFGLIPIVSKNNFLPSIVSYDRLVASDLTTETFASIISEVIDSGDFEILSQTMHKRVKQNFTQSIIEKKIKGIVEEIFCKN